MTDGLLLLDGPYVSDFLRETIRTHGLPVVCTSAAVDGTDLGAGRLIPADAARCLQNGTCPRVLTNSENALGWLAAHGQATPLPAQAEIFKNKVRTRELLRGMYPDFRFREIPVARLDDWEPADMPFPFVIKPAVGFFSLGVHLVHDRAHWLAVRSSLAASLAAGAAVYPQAVLDPTVFLAEECITGDEYAIDAWYDSEGRAVITNILAHRFSSAEDVGDRVYSTSVEILTRWLHPFTAWLNEVGALAGVRDFPVHVEVRVQPDGRIVPIEINPLRFGGWCTTADLAWHAWGCNPYLSFLRAEKPDWPAICAARDDRLWSVVVLDNTSGVDGTRIDAFDYVAVQARFGRVLECRPVDWRRYPLFGFLLVETAQADAGELDRILVDDLRGFVTRVE